MFAGLGLAIAVFSIGYFALMLRLRATVREGRREVGQQNFYLLVVPCLDEELVIPQTLESLLVLPASRSHVIVVDDASADNTAQLAESYPSDRVTVLRRTHPDAQRGKGAVLNFALAHIRELGFPVETVVGIIDADGRIDADLLDVVDSEFDDSSIGAVQIGVRIRNREKLLGRFQDLEFSSFSSIVQMARTKLGSVGLGGNGQFTRLGALNSLGKRPWTDCLTEDLDLGLQLVLAGWRIGFTDRTWVAQQGLTNLGRLSRQRTRWVQGHLQTWGRIPALLRSDLPNRTVLDLLYYLLTPMWMLLASVLFTVPIVALLVGAIRNPGGALPSSWEQVGWLALWYLLSFGMSLTLAENYRRTARDVSFVRSILLAHGLVIYNFVWYLAGWWAVLRIVRGKTGWVKTTRVGEVPVTLGRK